MHESGSSQLESPRLVFKVGGTSTLQTGMPEKLKSPPPLGTSKWGGLQLYRHACLISWSPSTSSKKNPEYAIKCRHETIQNYLYLYITTQVRVYTGRGREGAGSAGVYPCHLYTVQCTVWHCTGSRHRQRSAGQHRDSECQAPASCFMQTQDTAPSRTLSPPSAQPAAWCWRRWLVTVSILSDQIESLSALIFTN